MRHRRRAACALIALLAVATPAAAAPEGQLTWGVHISLAPTWFDPAETQGIITPFMVMYAIHDRSEEHTSELQSRLHLVCRLLLEKKKKTNSEMRPLEKIRKYEV